MPAAEAGDTGKIIGRYAVHKRIASGGMAAIHFGRVLGEAGFTRIVAIKRLHAQFANDPEFAAMFLDEARLAARIRHPNVVGTLDVVSADDELFLVMEYVPGESLYKLLRAAAQQGQRVPLEHTAAVLVGTLRGLHAAHEARSANGDWLQIVHRDVSPHNVLVGEDGVPRLIDFGVAKAVERIHSTRDGGLRGKIAYMAPEQLMLERLDRRADVYAAAVVLWEMLTGKRYLDIDNPAAAVRVALERDPEPPSRQAPGIPASLDAIALRGLARNPGDRFATALEMADTLERAVACSPTSQVAAWVEALAGDALRDRREQLRRIETLREGADLDVEERPADGESSWLPSDALQTEVSQPSSLSVETTRSLPRDSSGVRRATVVGVSVFLGTLVGATLLFASLRSTRGAPAATAASGSVSAFDLPTASPSTSSDAPPPAVPTVAVSALPIAAPSRAGPAAPPPRPPPASPVVPPMGTGTVPPAAPSHRLPLYSRD